MATDDCLNCGEDMNGRTWCARCEYPPHVETTIDVREIRTLCARALGESPNYPFFYLDALPNERADDTILRVFQRERPNSSTDIEAINVLIYG